MKKRVFSLALAFVLTLALVPAFTAPAQAAGTWQEAYTDVLRNPEKYINEYNRDLYGFSLYDIDSNGIPELFLNNNAPLPRTFTYINSKVVEVWEPALLYLTLPANSSLNGVFIKYPYAISFCTIESGKAKDTTIWVKDRSNGKETIHDQRLYNEWEESVEIDYYPVNATNIQTYITGTVANANTHPYATALQEFFKDAKGKTTAWLCDINGDGVQEMLAWKDGGDRTARFFYLQNGNLKVKDWTYTADSFAVYFSSSNYLIIFDAYTIGNLDAYVASLDNGELKTGTVVISHKYIEGTDGNYYNNGLQISKAEYDALWEKYGIEKNFAAPADQTAKILAMTAENKATSTPANRHIFATELEKFHKEAANYSAAVLADLDSDKVAEMIALKVMPISTTSQKVEVGIFAEKNSDSPFYYSLTTDIGFFELNSSYVSQTNYVVLDIDGVEGVDYYILSYTSGKFNAVRLGGNSYHGYVHDDVKITKSQYDGYLTKYGIGKINKALYGDNSADQTAQILAMTAAPSALTVNPTASTVYVNGKATAFEAYTIDGNNYFKLRDLAKVLSGSVKQFEVGYNNDTKAITLTSGKVYTSVGGEMAAGDGKAKTATPTASKIYLNGRELNLTVYTINGNNFFKLRDLMKAIDVYVGYDNATKNITLDTNKGYVGP